MSSAERYAMALGEPVLGLRLPPFCSQSVLGPFCLHTIVSAVPLLPYRSNSSALATQAPGFLSGLGSSGLRGALQGNRRTPSTTLGIHTPPAPSSPAGA